MNELTIAIDPKDGRRLYEQIYDYIRTEIREGKLQRGEKLPSTRSLAEYLQVSRSTVELSYEQLLSEGYIEAKAYKGYYVCGLEELYRIEVGTENRREAEREEAVRYDIDFSPNAIDMREFPFRSWKKISRNVLMDERPELFLPGSPQGDYELRETLCRYLHASRGVQCGPEEVIVGAGNDYLLMLLEKILGRNLKIAMENPTYKRACRIFRSFGYEVVPVDCDGSGLSMRQLSDTGAHCVYVMPSHQYPTGAVMPITRRLELLKWAAQEEGRYIIEDDYDSEFRYKGKPIPSLQASDKAGSVIYMGTFSKAIAPAIRVGYMVLPKRLLDKYLKHDSFYSCTVSRIDQAILKEFIRDGYFERHLNKMRKIYKTKHDLLLSECRKLEGKFSISGENSGLHILVKCREDRKEKDLIEAAARERIRVYGLSESYIAEKNEAATIILGYAALSEQEIKKGIAELVKAWL